jgi:hypothetical protein
MKNFLILLVAVITFSCDLTPAGPTPITIVNSNQNQNTNNSGGDSGDDATPPPVTTDNVVLLDPESIRVEVDRRVPVEVTVLTPSGVAVAAGDITATVLDPEVVMLSEVIGERAFFRGVSVGETIVIISAAGASAQLNVTVVPQS